MGRSATANGRRSGRFSAPARTRGSPVGHPCGFRRYLGKFGAIGPPLCTLLRILAQGDPSITLASAMHPLVLSSSRISTVPEPYTAAWKRQCQDVFDTVCEGCWWGTIVSEPGSGGDSGLTSAVVEPSRPLLDYRITGRKHFGSGSGMTSFMITQAVPVGERGPDLFYLDVRHVPWDGSTGMTLKAPWRGHGRRSTNSHACSLARAPGRAHGG